MPLSLRSPVVGLSSGFYTLRMVFKASLAPTKLLILSYLLSSNLRLLVFNLMLPSCSVLKLK